MKQVIPNSKRKLAGTVLATSLGALGLVFLAAANRPAPAPAAASALPPTAENHYIGVGKCKLCHSKEEMGDQYGVWEKSKHSMAFEALASDQAKAFAKERGITVEPQKAPECLKCHETAYGVDAKMIKRGFKPELGVQCETCHGPGEAHMKARLKAAMAEDPSKVPVEPGEIIKDVPEETCKGCHNSESPTFKAFCFTRMKQIIAHPTPATKAAMKPVDCTSCHDPVPEIKQK